MMMMKTKLILVVVLALCVFTQIAGAKTAVDWYNKGCDLDELGRYEEAIKAYDKALEIDPNHEEASYNKDLARRQLEPGFEAILAIAGLLAVAYLLRRRK